MNITKRDFKEILNETVLEYKAKIHNFNEQIEISFIDKEDYLDILKQDNLIKLQVELGIYKNLAKEYPNFIMVLNSDKDRFRSILGLPYKITICYEIAKDKMKKLTKKEAVIYLKHAFAHEITHIYQEQLKENHSNIWEDALLKNKQDVRLANEYLAEHYADKLANIAEYKNIEKKLWFEVFKRIEKLRRG